MKSDLNLLPCLPLERPLRVQGQEDEKGKEVVAVDVIVDQGKKKNYEKIKEMYLSGNYGTERIAIHLNQEGHLSPGGKTWTSNAVQRLLLHEFHMGIATYGKYEWKRDRDNNRKPVKKKPKEEWFIGEGNWEKLITDEDHQRILQIFQKNNKVPSRSKQGVFPTTSLMFCKKCGYSMKYTKGRLEAKSGKAYDLTKCNHRYPRGETCKQRGIKLTEEFYNALYNAVVESYLNSNIIKREQTNKQDLEKMQKEKFKLEKQLKDQETVLNRISDAYEEGVYSLKEFAERKKKNENNIKSLKKEIEKIDSQIYSASSYTKSELDYKVVIFKENWKSAITSKEQNDLLKSLVKRIIYNRVGDNLTLEIEHL